MKRQKSGLVAATPREEANTARATAPPKTGEATVLSSGGHRILERRGDHPLIWRALAPITADCKKTTEDQLLGFPSLEATSVPSEIPPCRGAGA